MDSAGFCEMIDLMHTIVILYFIMLMETGSCALLGRAREVNVVVMFAQAEKMKPNFSRRLGQVADVWRFAERRSLDSLETRLGSRRAREI